MTSREPSDVRELYEGVRQLIDTVDSNGSKVGDCKHGVYLFYDYDGEPIYVGQTREKLRTRIRRHLTNQRTDAVAMRVLDPFEVAEVELWPFWALERADSEEAREVLERAEYTVFQRALADSTFSAVLNEKEIVATETSDLPESVRAAILPESARLQREHPDIRLARRARTIADLARIISERKVTIGLRRTLLVQARRLEFLAKKRLEDLGGEGGGRN